MGENVWRKIIHFVSSKNPIQIVARRGECSKF